MGEGVLFDGWDIGGVSGGLAGLDAVVFVFDPGDFFVIAVHPEWEGGMEALLVELDELDDDVVTGVGRQVVEFPHVDAIGGTGLGAESAEEALGVVDGIAEEFSADGFAGGLVEFSGGGLVDVDAIDGAGLGALVAGDTEIGVELVDAAVTRREGESLFGVLDGGGVLEAVFEGDSEADGDRLDVVVDISEVFLNGHSRIFTFKRQSEPAERA